MEREAAPYGKCQEHNDPKYNVYGEKYPVDYSSQVCDTKNISVNCKL